MLAACSTPTPPPVDTSLTSFKAIGYSTRDTCPTQKEIAAHNSVYDTLKTGKLTVYRAPCEGKSKPGSASEAKTS